MLYNITACFKNVLCIKEMHIIIYIKYKSMIIGVKFNIIIYTENCDFVN